MRQIDKLISFFFPRRCAVCDRVISPEMTVCHECKKKVRLIEGPTCMKCGKRISDQGDMYCYDCRRYPTSYDRGFSVFEYQAIKESLYRFKYSGRAEYARFYAEKTYEKLSKVFLLLEIQAFIPVPIHKRRMNKRGYNQAYEFAKALSDMTEIPVMKDYVIRCKKTNPLKTMNRQERQKNLKKAFKLNKNDVKLQRICIIDDIYTTGSTINEIAELLRQNKVEKIYFVTIAIGKGM